MNREEIKSAVLRALQAVAPELDASTLDAGGSLREQLDIDSMDFLRFVVTLHQALHVDVPEADYGKIGTLDRCVDYLSVRLSQGARP